MKTSIVNAAAERRAEILVVDDSPGICEAVKAIVESQRPRWANVTTAASGEKAWLTLKDAHFDLVLSDYEMPGVKGLHILGQARRRNPRGHRILMTAYEDIPASTTDFLIASPDALLQKPFEPDDLLAVLRDFVEGRHDAIAKHRALVYQVVADELAPPPGYRAES